MKNFIKFLTFALVLTMFFSAITLSVQAGDADATIYKIDFDEFAKTNNATINNANYHLKALNSLYVDEADADAFGGLHIIPGQATLSFANGIAGSEYANKKVLHVDDSDNTGTNTYLKAGFYTNDTSERWFDEDFVVTYVIAIYELGGGEQNGEQIDIGMFSANPDTFTTDVVFRFQVASMGLGVHTFGKQNANGTYSANCLNYLDYSALNNYHTLSIAYDVSEKTADAYINGQLILAGRPYMKNSATKSDILTQDYYLEGTFIQHKNTKDGNTAFDVASINITKGLTPPVVDVVTSATTDATTTTEATTTAVTTAVTTAAVNKTTEVAENTTVVTKEGGCGSFVSVAIVAPVTLAVGAIGTIGNYRKRKK